MKKIIITASLLLAATLYSQVAIGKNTVTNNFVSLEFGNGPRGILLPYVQNESAVPAVEGSIIYDAETKKVKYYNGSWQDLSVVNSGVVDLAPQQGLTERSTAKSSIGIPTSTPGILVLEDKTKAMILPKVDSPHLAIQNPAAGMMVYDTAKKLLCLYNGTEWTFWKPGD